MAAKPRLLDLFCGAGGAAEVERALAEILDDKSYVTVYEARELAIKRTASILLPSEDSSDE